MSSQERKLPEDDREIVLMWELHDHNYSAVAREYGVCESSARKRIQAIVGDATTIRPYRKLPVSGEQLYREWTALKKRYGAIPEIAAKYDVKPDTVQKAVHRYERSRDARSAEG